MARKKRAKVDGRIFKYWIELKSVDDGSVRVLPMKCFRCIPLVNDDHPLHGNESIEIRVEDVDCVFVGQNLDEIAAQLRAQYPHGKFERFLKVQRDKDAEEKRKSALDELAMIFVRAAIDDLLKGELGLGIQ